MTLSYINVESILVATLQGFEPAMIKPIYILLNSITIQYQYTKLGICSV